MKGIFTVFLAVISFFVVERAQAKEAQGERPLLQFHLAGSASPRVGEAGVLFIQVDTENFLRNEVVLDLDWNGLRFTNLIQSAPSLWVASFPVFTEIKAHLVSARVFARDAKRSASLKASIESVAREIAELEKAIAAEPEESKRLALEALRDKKVAYKEELESALQDLKVFLKAENFSFEVVENPENLDFPFIQSLSRNVGLTEGGTIFTISGERFPANPVVLLGGQEASVLSASTTLIEVLTPPMPVGIKDLEIKFPGIAPKNAVRKNAFFVTGEAILKNLRPVASAIGYYNPLRPEALTLDGSASYDENLDDYDFVWRILVAPRTSSLIPGTFLENSATPVLPLDRRGVYVIELKTREKTTRERFESLPVHVTVEVGR